MTNFDFTEILLIVVSLQSLASKITLIFEDMRPKFKQIKTIPFQGNTHMYKRFSRKSLYRFVLTFTTF